MSRKHPEKNNENTKNYEDTGCGSRSEILWSREKNSGFFENDFFKTFQIGVDFSDTSDRSTSSCSWHNDDFDLQSSNQVSASLEAIEDALYDRKQSAFISQDVYNECLAWVDRYPYLRINGEHLTTPTVSIETSVHANSTESSNNILLVEGKKMSLHFSEKHIKKIPTDRTSTPGNQLDGAASFDDCNECLEVDTKDSHTGNFPQLDNDDLNKSSELLLRSAKENVIEQLAQEIWPKVIEILNSLDDVNQNDDPAEFQLPPILSARRPRTEGTETFSELSSKFDRALFVSNKFSTSKPDSQVWKPTRASRPSSEIHSTRQSRLLPNSRLNRLKDDALRVSSLSLQPRQPIKLSNIKQIIQEEPRNSSILLPVVNEDILLPSEFSNKQDSKECNLLSSAYNNSWKRTDTFLPPIDRKTNGTSNPKLPKNLFTLLEPDAKNDRKKRNGSAWQNSITPLTTSRPNTSASRKNLKYHRNILKDFSNNDSPIKYCSTRRTNVLSDQPVALFPIVTPITPCKERNTSSALRKGYPNVLTNKKR